MSEVRGSGRECQSAMAQEQPRRATQVQVRGQGRQPRGATPHLRPGVEAGRSNLTPKARGGGGEEIPHAPSLMPGVAGWRRYPMPLSRRPGATGGGSYPTPLSPRPRAAVGRSTA